MKISLEKLSKSYRDADRTLTIINELDFLFPPGASVAILGRSGVGKSTLLQLLGGLDRPSSGRVVYDSTVISDLDADQLSSFRGRHVGFIFQFHHLLAEFSALENVAMPLIIGGSNGPECYESSAEVLKRVGLGQRLTHRPGELSGGEQQRVAVARAIVTKPDVILADEPTGNLDSATAAQVQGLLKEINRELRNTLIVVTHNMELAKSMDLVLEMQDSGRLERL